jgi:hypothetical protein
MPTDDPATPLAGLNGSSGGYKSSELDAMKDLQNKEAKICRCTLEFRPGLALN